MKAGSITRTHMAIVLILIVGAGAYMYFKQILPEHQAANTTAIAAQDAATQRLAEVSARQGQVTQGKVDPTALARIMTAGMAVPPKENIAASMLEIQDLAARSGFTVTSIGSEAATEGSNTNIQLDGHASFQNVSFFLSRLQRLVEQRSDKVYVRGRLYNVAGITLGTGEGAGSGEDAAFNEDPEGGGGGGTSESKPGELQVSITIQMFSSGEAATADPGAVPAGGEDAANGQAAGAGAAGADGAGAEGAAGQGAGTADPAAGAGTADPAAGTGGAQAPGAGAGAGSNVDTGQVPGGGQAPASGSGDI